MPSQVFPGRKSAKKTIAWEGLTGHDVRVQRAKRPPASLGQAIKAARRELGWSQAKLARELDTSEKNVSNWEAGRNLPSHPLYSRMCLLFGWPLPYSGKSHPARDTRLAEWGALLGPSGLALIGA